MRLAPKTFSLFYLTVSPHLRNSSSFTAVENFRKKGSYNVKVGNTLFTSSSLNSNTSNDGIGLSEIGKEQTNNKAEKANPENSTKMSNDTISSWREKIEISIAKSRKIRGGNYVQIATVDRTTLEPRCRTVVFRGFLKSEATAEGQDGGKVPVALPIIMKMITDKRSNKFYEVTNIDVNSDTTSNTVEMVWWFAKSSEQYRIRGQLKFVGEDEADQKLLIARKEQWGNLSDMAREQFYWIDPGLSYDDDKSTEAQGQIPVGGRDTNGKVLPPPENFLLMLLYPKRCDYLRLSDNFRQVDDFNGVNWESNRVNP